MNILITGIHGFVGTNLVQVLKSNHSIYGLDIVSPEKNGVLKTYGWNDLDILPSIDIVIHLAGKAHDTKNQTLSQVYFDINTGLTQKIYDWFLMSSASKFIFFSSVKAAAEKVDEVLTEEVIPTPMGPYGESKIAAENYILKQQAKSLKQRIGKENISQQTFILRPCMIHGPGNKGNLNLLYKFVKKGIPYPMGAFENNRSFCSVENLIFVINSLINKDVESGIYNVCDDETVSTNDLINMISVSINKSTNIWMINKQLIEFVARIGNIFRLPFNSTRLQKLTENYVVSNAKIKNALGVSSMPIKAKEGFAKTLESFKS